MRFGGPRKLLNSRFLVYLVLLLFRSEFHSASQGSLKLAVEPTLALNSQQLSCLYQTSARIRGVCHNTRLGFYWGLDVKEGASAVCSLNFYHSEGLTQDRKKKGPRQYPFKENPVVKNPYCVFFLTWVLLYTVSKTHQQADLFKIT